ncbi:AAA family ATPase [Kitasatospora indigofera]|uniref:AAA family ATPase n=1 Tax=Kitasatospora indigofera TaxID=67307 RepID=UPI0036C3A695
MADELASAVAAGPVGALFVLIGPAGCGKSTLVSGLPSNTVVSLDELRRQVCGDPGDQSATAAAVELQNRLLEQRLGAGLPTVLDSTNVESRVRADLLARAKRHGRPAVAVRFSTGLDDCLARNARRVGSSRVPEDVVRRQHALAVEAGPGLVREGFARVLLWDGRQLSDGAAGTAR